MELYFLRHAEAEAKAPGMEDVDRALTEEGRKVIGRVIEGLKRDGVRFDIIFTSPLFRARQTAEILANTLSPAGGTVVTNALLVGSPPSELVAELKGRQVLRIILIVGHEPHLGMCIAWLTGKGEEETKLKKGACARVEVTSPGEGRGELSWIKRAEEF